MTSTFGSDCAEHVVVPVGAAFRQYIGEPVVLDGQHRAMAVHKGLGLVAPTGEGKTEFLLRLLLMAHRKVAFLLVAREDAEAQRLTRQLLQSAERDTGLPSISAVTAPAELIGVVENGTALDEQATAEALGFWTGIYRRARREVRQRINVANYEFVCCTPLHHSSPCGVLGCAVPHMPRAPGRPASSPVLSKMLAAA